MTPLANLAKQAVETYITTKKIIKPPKNFPSTFLKKRAGVFVTIEEKDQELRGCIGTYLPVRNNIAEETIYNAIAAATEDYRFMPIQKNELSNLTYTVSILGQPEQILDISDLNPKKYGVIVSTPDRLKTGLLLPDLAGVDTVEKQIMIACQKAGINLSQEKIALYRFTTEKYQ